MVSYHFNSPKMKIHSFLLVLPLFFVFCGREKTEQAVQIHPDSLEIHKVKVAPVTGTETNGIIRATGLLVSDLESRPAFKIGGVIEKTYFGEGDKVSKGALLARLNQSEISAQVRQARMAVEKTSRDFDRVNNLHADSVATLEQLQNAGTALDMAKESLRIAEFNQQFAEVRSPVSGTIVKQLLRQGEIAGPGMPVYAIMGTGRQDWKIKSAVSDKEWARIKKGDHAEVWFEAYPGLRLQGVVDQVAEMSNPGTATLDIEIRLPGQNQKLAAGLLCKVEIRAAARMGSLKTIPIEALVSSNQGLGIIYVIEDGKAVRKTVRIDKILGDQVAVSSGLEKVGEVITAGAFYLEEGHKVQIIQ